MDENIEKHRNDFAADVSKQHLASLPPYNEKSLRSEDDWKKYEEEYEKFVTFIRLKGERYLEAKAHPGQGRAERHTPGERELEGR